MLVISFSSVASSGVAPLTLPPDVTNVSKTDAQKAAAFQAWILSLGSTGTAIYPLLPAIKTAMGVGFTNVARTNATLDPRWSSTFLRLADVGANVAANLNITNGQVYIDSANPTTVSITNLDIHTTAGFYGIQRGLTGPGHVDTYSHITITGGQAAGFDGVGPTTCSYILSQQQPGDNFKFGTNITYELCWGEAAGYNDPSAHGDGFQTTGGSNAKILNCVLFSVHATQALHPEYTTNSYGLTQAVRIVNEGANLDDIVVMGVAGFHGGIYPFAVSSGAPFHVRNVTLAYNIGLPDEFRVASDTVKAQLYPSLDQNNTGPLENVAFFGNKLINGSPWLYNGTDVTGIWGWNPATLSDAAKALWIELGLLDGSGVPIPGAVRTASPDLSISLAVDEVIPSTVPAFSTGSGNITVDLPASPGYFLRYPAGV
jgi:hypothetical protein